MKHHPVHSEPAQEAAPEDAKTREHAHGEKTRKLLANLQEILQGRRGQRGGVYLPLVRVERED